MTTLIVQLPPVLAKRLARAADQLGMSHSEIGALAVRLFILGAEKDARTHARTRKVRTNSSSRSR